MLELELMLTFFIFICYLITMFFISKSNHLNIHQKFISFLFILMPVLLITGPFLSDLALSIIAIYYFFLI